jgi:pheromone shutdown-related protein TraB
MEEINEMHSGEEIEAPGPDFQTVRTDGREFILVGTAHVSKESVERVRETIEGERPDRVCVELDDKRYEALSKQTQWENLDLKQVIRRKQLATLLVNLLLASFQRKIGGKLGVVPGMELLEATRAAEEHGIPFSLCDRNILVTILRAWRSMSFFQKFKLLGGLLESVFGDVEITEEELEKLRSKDVLSELMNEMAEAMPSLKTALIDERDTYLAEKIRAAEGNRIVAVVGAGHVEGIRRILARTAPPTDLEPIETIPSAFPLWKWIGWAVPVVILGSLGLIAYTQGGAVAGRNLLYWILANGIPSGIGAILALGHPLTVLAAFLCAPITSLTPVIGAGYVCAFVQAYFQPPLVHDFQTLWQDVGSLKRWWGNRLLKVFLALIFPSIGSMIGTYLGGYEIITNLFR